MGGGGLHAVYTKKQTDSVTVIKYKDGKYTVESVNDMSYSQAGKAILATQANQNK